MQVYFDESGSFNVVKQNDISVLSSVVIPENINNKLDKF